jgi:hypothetical protein
MNYNKYVFLNDQDTFSPLQGAIVVSESSDGSASYVTYDLAGIMSDVEAGQAKSLSSYIVATPASAMDALEEN